jgi:nucleoside-diphosphate-sugar epimerase
MKFELDHSPKVVLITGISGFLGRYIAENYKSCGWEVHGILRKSSRKKTVISYISSSNLHQMSGDHSSINSIMRKVKPDLVVHLASLFISEHNPENIDDLILSNILFGVKLLEAMRINNIKKIINAGTSWQNFKAANYCPVNLYAATKQAFSDLLEYYVDAEGFSAVTLKLTDTYGYDDHRKKIINLLSQAISDRKILEISPGEQLVDLVHGCDVAECFRIVGAELLSNEEKGHSQFYVGSGKPISLKSLVKIMEEICGVTVPVIWGARNYRDREVMIPFEGNTYPGWKPKIKLRDGLRVILKNNSELE